MQPAAPPAVTTRSAAVAGNRGPGAVPAEVVAVSAAHSVDFLPPGKSK